MTCRCGLTIPPGHALCGDCWRTVPAWAQARYLRAVWFHGSESEPVQASARTAQRYAGTDEARAR